MKRVAFTEHAAGGAIIHLLRTTTSMKTRTRAHQEIRDCVHGFVKLNGVELNLINTPEFQRLRDIRQLAMGHMVYPGANHTRFEHSIGCVHLSSLVFDAIEARVKQQDCPNFAEAFRLNDENYERGKHILRIAALLHDVGHPPFSHSGEEMMPCDGSDNQRQLSHEDMTAKLIRETQLGEILEKDDISREEVIAVAVDPEKANARMFRADWAWYRFLNEILTGELGSDRMDYLLRDAHHSGQDGGRFDYRKLVDSMTIVPPLKETEEPHRLGLDSAGWLVAEQMVAARYLMYLSLYFHKTKRIYEVHLEEFTKEWLKDRYGCSRFPADIEKYVQITDSSVLGAVYSADGVIGSELRKLAKPFRERTHFRLAHELVLADNGRPHASGNPERRRWDRERFDRLADEVRIEFGNEQVRVDAVQHTAIKFLGDGHKVRVLLDSQPRSLGDLSEIVRGMPDQISRGRIYADESIRSQVAEFAKKWLCQNPVGGTGK